MNPRMKKVLVPLTAATAGLTLWLGLASRSEPGRATLPPLPDPGAEPALAGPRPAEATTASARPAWHPTRAWSGRFTLDVDARLERSASLGGDGAVTLVASLELAPLPAPHDGWVGGRLAVREVGGDAALREHFVVADATPQAFALQVDDAGVVVADRYAPGMPSGLRNLVATLAVGLVPEGDVAGTTAAWTWRRGDDASQGGGLPTGRGQSEVARDELGIVTAAYTYTLDADVTLDASTPMWQRVTTRMRLVRDDAAAATRAPVTPVDATTLVSEREREARQPRPVRPTRGQSVDELVAASAEAHAARDQTRQGELAADLVATVEAGPAALATLVERLHDATLAGHNLRTLTTALVDARSPAAEAALAELIGDATAPYLVRHSLVSALTFVKRLAPEVLAAARALLDDHDDPVRVAAAHALAAQGKLQEARDPVLAAALRADLLARATPSLTGAGDADKDLWLSALGNLGGPEVWTLVAPHVTSRVTSERLHALEALRFVALPAARVALAKAMKLDPDHANRRRAVELALFHPQVAMQEPIVRALQEDPDPGVRLGAAHVLAVWGVTSPALNDIVARAADAERHPEVRRAMHELAPVSLDDRGAP